MKIEKDSVLGKVTVNIPIEGITMMQVNNTKYPIQNISIFSEDKIFLINRTWGVWINIFDILEFKKSIIVLLSRK